MIQTPHKITISVATVLLSIGVGVSAQGFPGAYSSLTRVDRQVQLAGKVVCTNCSLEDARKVQPRYTNHLYRVMVGQEQAVMEVQQTSAPTWLHHLTPPPLRIQGDEQLLRTLTDQESQRKDLVVSGTLLDSHTLQVTDVERRN
jgi:hypothetical protein